MFVCVFSIEIETAGRIWMKFGRELVLKGGKVLGGLVGVGHFLDPKSGPHVFLEPWSLTMKRS